jgi:hypothetical protein
MNAEKSGDDDESVKASPDGTSPEGMGLSEVERPPQKDAIKTDDDATVKILPGGPPPRDTKGILRPAKWTLSPGQSLIVSLGKGLNLEMIGNGCVIKTKKQR